MKISAYGEKLRDPRWQRKRLEIMQRDNFSCQLCGDPENTLNVHHLHYTKGADPWDYANSALVTVCESCHEELHVARFGESILESLIEGGADMHSLYGVLYAFEYQFSYGPSSARIPGNKWEDVVGAINFALMAVARGASEGEINDALKTLHAE